MSDRRCMGIGRVLALSRWCERRGYQLGELLRLANHSRFEGPHMLSVERARWIVSYVRRWPREANHGR